MSLTRRGLLGVLGAALAAPAVIRTPGLLMPVRRVVTPPALGYMGFVSRESIAAELSAVTRRAVVPALFVADYTDPMRALLDGQTTQWMVLAGAQSLDEVLVEGPPWPLA